MDRKTTDVLFALIRNCISNEDINSTTIEQISSIDLDGLFDLSLKHDISHLVAFSLLGNNLVENNNKIAEKLKKCNILAVMRYEKIKYELSVLCKLLEDNKIEYIPLKGSVIRDYYPEPWMRTSCDIDILVKMSQLAKVEKLLVNNLNYRKVEAGPHDISFFSECNINVEIHYDLVEDNLVNNSSRILKNVWNDCVLKDDTSYHHLMSNEMFCFYHIAHMAKHILNGGCGIRPFIDLWIINKKLSINSDKLLSFLKEGNLLDFYNKSMELVNVWLDGKTSNELTDLFEHFVIFGGVYGNNVNRIAVGQRKKKSRLKFALARIFLPYNDLKFHYPILQKHKILTPVFQVVRWFKLIFCGGFKRSKRELLINKNLSSKKLENTKILLDDLGL